MEKVFFDTGAWVALFVKNDINHKKAVLLFNRMKDSKMTIYTSDYVIDETITTILYRGNHKQSVIAGEAIWNSDIIKIVYITPDDLQETWKSYKKYKDKKFSFTDVSCLTIMKNLSITKAFSFDREFTQAGIALMD